MSSHDVSMVSRFWAKVDKTEDCWNWTASTHRDGYGRLAKPGHNAGMVFTHRYAYELLVGPIPEGLELDHLCRNRACVNPDHMEPVTHAVNVLRGISPQAENARKTACHQGHPFSGTNLYVYPGGGRHCRACRKARDRARRAAQAVTAC